MYTNTVDASKVEMLEAPDWSQPVRFWQTWQTDVSSSRNGSEQRNRKRSRPRYSIAFMLSAYTRVEWGLRRMAMMREMGAPMIVPLWTVPEAFVSEAAGVVTLDVTSLAKTPFYVDGYAYVVEDGLESFLGIVTAIGANTVTLSGGVIPAYTSAALVYPCIVGQRSDNTMDSRHVHLDNAEEVIYVQEL